jgi:SAM-dependent methyltransferase
MTETVSVSVERCPALRACPVCHGESGQRFLSFPSVPVFCNVLWDSREEALAAPMSRIDLAFCVECGHIYNDSFDPALVAYSPRYENSLHHSAVFRQYTSDLVRRLVNEHGLRGKRILEIGCGQGDFLSELCLAGKNIGIGFDPSFAGGPLPAGVERIEAAYFSPDFVDIQPDAIICRQVLEHIEDPSQFLGMIREAIGERRDVLLSFEVPNGLWCFGGGGIWDVIYEHCGYFTPSSLERAFRLSSFEVLEVQETFERQFLTVVAKPGPVVGCQDASRTSDGVSRPLTNTVLTAALAMARRIDEWRVDLERIRREVGPVVVWGVGSKGVTFLNLADPRRLVEYAVDLNPRKHGMFIPGTGQVVMAPELLSTCERNRAVVVMNPNYAHEIAARMGALGLHAEYFVG